MTDKIDFKNENNNIMNNNMTQSNFTDLIENYSPTIKYGYFNPKCHIKGKNRVNIPNYDNWKEY